MKYSGLNVLSACLLICCLEPRSKEVKILMDDPIIGLSYDPALVQFEQCPRSLDTRDAAVEGKQWIFAKCIQPLDTLYIVSSLMRLWNDQEDKWIDSILEPDFGVVIRIEKGNAKAIGTPDGLYGKHAVLPAQKADCLMNDAANRYIVAFGGPTGLQSIFAKGKITAETLPASFVRALKIKGVLVPVTPLK